MYPKNLVKPHIVPRGHPSLTRADGRVVADEVRRDCSLGHGVEEVHGTLGLPSFPNQALHEPQKGSWSICPNWDSSII